MKIVRTYFRLAFDNVKDEVLHFLVRTYVFVLLDVIYLDHLFMLYCLDFGQKAMIINQCEYDILISMPRPVFLPQ